MKSYLHIFFLIYFNINTFCQISDTCDYVSQNNYLQDGLDCVILSSTPFTPESYQWLNCSNSYSIILNDTTYIHTKGETHYLALELTYLGCIDTSDCVYVCFYGLEELKTKNIELISIFDPLGRETEDKSNTLLIYQYSDGTREKVYKIE